MTISMPTASVQPEQAVLFDNLASTSGTEWHVGDFHTPPLHQLRSSSLLEETKEWQAWTKDESINSPIIIEAFLDMHAKYAKYRETLLFTSWPDIKPDTPSSPSTGLQIDLIARAYIDRIEKALNPELYDALYDLQEATDEALEEGFPVPSEIALENAERLLREMYWISPRRFEVYPTPDGEIAIDAPGGHRRSVLLLCDSEGGALCLVNMNGNHRRARYDTTNTLPDGFVREALIELEQWDHKTP